MLAPAADSRSLVHYDQQYAAGTLVIDLASVLAIRTDLDLENNWNADYFDAFLVVLNAMGCVCKYVCVLCVCALVSVCLCARA